MLKPKLIIDNAVVEDQWLLINDESTEIPTNTKTIVPLALWETDRALQQNQAIGVLLPNTIDLVEMTIEFNTLPVIAIDFPVFMDGRGFSLARLLRERYRYKGELRAVGHVIRDQLCYLKRCGFNAFVLSEDVDLEKALHSLNDFTEVYQTAADQQQPLFRRRA